MIRTLWLNIFALAAAAAGIVLVVSKNIEPERASQLVNVSYDPTRELYADINKQFVAAFEKKTGRRLVIEQSHGGSSRQARAVIDGQDADVVTLGLPSDIDALRKHNLVAADWRDRFPFHARPYTSTIIFVVRKGNPRGVRDWPDLINDGVSVITPDPRSSSNGKLSVLAAYGSVIYRGGSPEAAATYLRQLFEHISVLDSGARGATTTFTEGKTGDVHLTWENEALWEVSESKGELEAIYPPVSISAEPAVAVVDSNANRAGTAAYAKEYLGYLFTDAGQETVAKYGYRPSNPEILARYSAKFPVINIFPVTILGADWGEVQQKFFASDGIFEIIHGPKKNS